jgi:hypothetical protein
LCLVDECFETRVSYDALAGRQPLWASCELERFRERTAVHQGRPLQTGNTHPGITHISPVPMHYDSYSPLPGPPPPSCAGGPPPGAGQGAGAEAAGADGQAGRLRAAPKKVRGGPACTLGSALRPISFSPPSHHHHCTLTLPFINTSGLRTHHCSQCSCALAGSGGHVQQGPAEARPGKGEKRRRGERRSGGKFLFSLRLTLFTSQPSHTPPSPLTSHLSR